MGQDPSKPELQTWERVLLSLPEASFSEIIHNHLENEELLKDRERLIRRLISYLKSPRTRNRIISLMDRQDAELLTAIHLLNRPTTENLFSFLEGKRSTLDLYRHILNLEKRLIIYKNHLREEEEIKINPLLHNLLLKRKIINTALLFPYRRCNIIVEDQPPWLTESILLAFLSYLNMNPEIIKSNGRIKKKHQEEIRSIFPGIFKSTPRGRRLDLLLSVLLNTGLVRAVKSRIVPVTRRWEYMGEWDREKLYPYLWSSAISEDQSLPFHIYTKIVWQFILLLDKRKAMELSVMQRLVKLLLLKAKIEDNSKNLLETLIALEVIVHAGGDLYRKNSNLDSFPNKHSDSHSRPSLILQPNFELTLKPGISLSDGFPLALVSRIKKYDYYPVYEICRESFIKGLEKTQDTVSLYNHLERVHSSPLPQNVIFTMKNWEQEYGGIKLLSGVILVVDEERRHLIEHTEGMKRWIKATLSPGIYLLDPREEANWKKEIISAGISTVPEIKSPSSSGGDTLEEDFTGIASTFPDLPNLESAFPLDVVSHDECWDWEERGPEEPHGIEKELLNKLRKLDIPDKMRKELEERIKKKLLLFPEQIKPCLTEKEKTEAKGVDNLGKIRLIEIAVKSGTDMLEIIERTSAGSPRKLMLKPVELAKKFSELVLTGITVPGKERVKIPLKKIVIVRKLTG